MNTRSLPLALLPLAFACATTADKPAEDAEVDARPAFPISELAAAVVDAPDRSEKDRETDARRHPAEVLTFMGVQPGWRVADLGAGAGYTTELLARAVGPEGRVWGQNNAFSLERFVGKSWPARLEKDVMQNVVRVDAELEDPIPDDATELDLVTLLFYFHDAVVMKTDRAKMLADIHAALKPGGVFVVADHNAPEGSGLEVAERLHRIAPEIVRAEIEAAGFELDAASDLYRDPSDDRTTVSHKVGFRTDRFLFKFRRAGARGK